MATREAEIQELNQRTGDMEAQVPAVEVPVASESDSPLGARRDATDEEFAPVAEYVRRKNAELMRRLA